MKKLIIALAAVALAFSSQAAATQWKYKTAMSGGAIKVPGGTANLNKAGVYVFLASSASSVLSSWYNEGTIQSLSTIAGALDSTTTTSAGKVSEKTFSYDSSGANLNLIIASEYTDKDGNKYLYISPSASVAYTESGANTAQFAATATSSAAALPAKDGYKSAGWYSSVPEPTSGLLLLLGMAGLALRRRRA